MNGTVFDRRSIKTQKKQKRVLFTGQFNTKGYDTITDVI